MKKLLIVGVFVFAFALTANVAFACPGGCGQPICPCPDQSNTAWNVTNNVSSSANTGGNEIEKGTFNGATSIYTGGAGATTYGINAVNSNLKSGWSWKSTQSNNAIVVKNSVSADANTGANEIGKGTFNGGTSIYTNGAGSTTKGINLVNTNVKIGGGWGF